MRYDFRKVQQIIDEMGLTLKDAEKMTGLDYTTISKALKTNRAWQSTAKTLTSTFGLSMKDIQVQPKNGARKSA